MRLDTLPSSLTRPSSKRWLVEERNSITRNSAWVQSRGSCGSRSASGHCVVETSLAKEAFCGPARAASKRSAHASRLISVLSSLIPPPDTALSLCEADRRLEGGILRSVRHNSSRLDDQPQQVLRHPTRPGTRRHLFWAGAGRITKKNFSSLPKRERIHIMQKRNGLAALRQCNSNSLLVFQHRRRAWTARMNSYCTSESRAFPVCDRAIKQREK